MPLIPITEKAELDLAYASMRQSFSRPKALTRTLGWHGGHEELDVHWHAEHGFWVGFGTSEDDEAYWSPFGNEDPREQQHLNMTFQVNMEMDGVRRNRSGLLLKNTEDGSGYYLAHDGGVGGGKAGIGKKAFLTYFGDPSEEIRWPDGKSSHAFVFGKLGSRRMYQNIARYSKAIHAFKAGHTGVPKEVVEENPDWDYSPEFSGQRKAYTSNPTIEANVSHGDIVDALKDALTLRGKLVSNTGSIDLLIRKSATITHIFEVKPTFSTTNLYQAIGQLMFHGAIEKSRPMRIMVLPAGISNETITRLRLLNIHFVSFDWSEGKPVFSGLDNILA